MAYRLTVTFDASLGDVPEMTIAPSGLNPEISIAEQVTQAGNGSQPEIHTLVPSRLPTGGQWLPKGYGDGAAVDFDASEAEIQVEAAKTTFGASCTVDGTLDAGNVVVTAGSNGSLSPVALSPGPYTLTAPAITASVETIQEGQSAGGGVPLIGPGGLIGPGFLIG